MAEKTQLQLDCPERVAFDLMTEIARVERSHTKNATIEQQDRQYYLSLYFECLQTVLRTSSD
jgi:hypothetical protein